MIRMKKINNADQLKLRKDQLRERKIFLEEKMKFEWRKIRRQFEDLTTQDAPAPDEPQDNKSKMIFRKVLSFGSAIMISYLADKASKKISGMLGK